MEIKRGELKKDAIILARHAKDALARGSVEGRVYAFEDFGEHHAQILRNELKKDPVTRGRFGVRKSKSQYPGRRDIVVR